MGLLSSLRTVCQLPRQSPEDNEVILTKAQEEQEVKVPCEEDWSLIGSRCYQTVNMRSSITKDQAEKVCQTRGGEHIFLISEK